MVAVILRSLSHKVRKFICADVNICKLKYQNMSDTKAVVTQGKKNPFVLI